MSEILVKKSLFESMRAENKRLAHESALLRQCFDTIVDCQQYWRKVLTVRQLLRDLDHLSAEDLQALDQLDARVTDIITGRSIDGQSMSTMDPLVIACEATLQTNGDNNNDLDGGPDGGQQHRSHLNKSPEHHSSTSSHHHKPPQQQPQHHNVANDGGHDMVSKTTYIIPVKTMADEDPHDGQHVPYDCHHQQQQQHALPQQQRSDQKSFVDSMVGRVAAAADGHAVGIATPLLPNDIKCVVADCRFTAPNKSALIRHLSRVHAIAPYECQYVSCGQLFASRDDLELHVNRKHLKIYRCHWHGCGKNFKSLWNLNIHLMTHSADKRFKCNVEDCDYQCIQKRHLIAHMYKHYGLKPFQCHHQSCGKSFSTIGSLRTHVTEVHASSHAFVCDFPGCNKVLKTQRYLLQHRKVHFNGGVGGGHASGGGGGGGKGAANRSAKARTAAAAAAAIASSVAAAAHHSGHSFKY